MVKTRTTRQKQLITDMLNTASQPLTATDIYRRAVEKCPSLAKSTVYRNLDTMARHGEVQRGFLESGEAFFFPTRQAHRHYMICRDCNRMQDIPDCPLVHVEQHWTDESGFVPTEHVLQIYGYCRDCAHKHEQSV